MHIEEVADEIYRLEVSLPSVDSVFAVYLIRERQGVLVEPGPTVIVPFVQEEMKSLGMKELTYIIPTHIHIDHAGGMGSLAQLFPEAKVILHPRAVKHAIDPSRLIESSKAFLGDDFETILGPVLPVAESQLKVPTDGEIIYTDTRKLQILYAPGHASHHMVIFDHKTQGLFCGEALGVPQPGTESSPLPAAVPPDFDVDVYLNTMDEIRQINPSILFYSHNGVGKEPMELISRASENTKVLSDMISESLRRGETIETIAEEICVYVSSRFGVKEGIAKCMTLAYGYASYFNRKGLH